MNRILLLLLLGTSLSGCASISYPLPKCDGYSRRQLNRSLWQSEDEGRQQAPANEISRKSESRAVPFVKEPAAEKTAVFARFDSADLYRPCEGN
ncbi:Hypothetical protein AT6N2_L0870 [Agrobacterium tumefaciens]|uniref:hypothetical protein n=1 Tax=Agrobacterium tumefaciens TaxID=358 RepID=UPI001ADA05A4|nr:hypothetical protein [Agrobacterium tumefaciens]QTK81725.1 Hypothetical protein AT6N2_L0870 [Agrobacterium tumefaciens]